MSEMNIDWGCNCSLGSEGNKFKKCIKCEKAFHLTCLTWDGDITAMEEYADWVGPCCIRCEPGAGDKNHTPVRTNTKPAVRASKRQALSSPPVNVEGPVTRTDVRDLMEEVIKKHMADLMIEMNKNMRSLLDSELKVFHEEINGVKQAMDYMNGELEIAKKENVISRDATSKLQESSLKMADNLKSLETRISNLEQISRNNNVEIQCLPEKKTENLMTLFKTLCNAVKCDLNETNVSRITRIAKLNQNSDRPRSVVVEFDSNRTRDVFLAATIKYNKANPDNKLNTSHFGFSGSKSAVYVAEHLSAGNKALHSAARQVAKEKGFKFVWVRGGRVFMRKSESAGFIFVKDFDTLSKIE